MTKKQKIVLPTMHAMKSSSIAALGHHGDELFVTFQKGQTYRYPGVTAKEFEALKGAESAGRHLQLHVLSKIKGELVPKGEA